MGLDSKKDVYLDGSFAGSVLEILAGPSGRRVRSEAERARIAAAKRRESMKADLTSL